MLELIREVIKQKRDVNQISEISKAKHCRSPGSWHVIIDFCPLGKAQFMPALIVTRRVVLDKVYQLWGLDLVLELDLRRQFSAIDECYLSNWNHSKFLTLHFIVSKKKPLPNWGHHLKVRGCKIEARAPVACSEPIEWVVWTTPTLNNNLPSADWRQSPFKIGWGGPRWPSGRTIAVLLLAEVAWPHGGCFGAFWPLNVYS